MITRLLQRGSPGWRRVLFCASSSSSSSSTSTSSSSAPSSSSSSSSSPICALNIASSGLYSLADDGTTAAIPVEGPWASGKQHLALLTSRSRNEIVTVGTAGIWKINIGAAVATQQQINKDKWRFSNAAFLPAPLTDDDEQDHVHILAVDGCYRISLTTGDATRVGSTPFLDVKHVLYDRVGRRLIVASGTGLYAVDPRDGSVVRSFPHPHYTDMTSSRYGFHIDCGATDSDDRTVLYMTSKGLHRLNVATGVWHEVDGQQQWPSGCAVATSDGHALVYSAGFLYGFTVLRMDTKDGKVALFPGGQARLPRYLQAVCAMGSDAGVAHGLGRRAAG